MIKTGPHKKEILAKAIDIIKEMEPLSNWDTWILDKEEKEVDEITRKLEEAFPDEKPSIIRYYLNSLNIGKLRREISHGNLEHKSGKKENGVKEIYGEQLFYESFANWLVNNLKECTKAIPLGGSTFRDKWGTPDVIGIYEPSENDLIKRPIEIISAEIKTDTTDYITAFGQACAYKIFSHKSYIVIPKEGNYEDQSRIDSLCSIFGIGLVIFNSSEPSNPQYEIRHRSSKHEPDMSYVNKYISIIQKELFVTCPPKTDPPVMLG